MSVGLKRFRQMQGRQPDLVQQNRLSSYHPTAESVAAACFTIDSHWLVDRQSELWRRLCCLDFKASEFERRGETGADYKQILERIVSTVKEAWMLYEQERQQGAAVQ